LRDARLGAAESLQRVHRRYGVPLALILFGGILAFGAPSIIQLSDHHAARARVRETETWVRRYESTSLPAVTATSTRKTVVVPDRDGYLLVIPKIGLRVLVRELEPDVFSGRNTPILRRYGLGQVPYTHYLRNGSPGADGTAVIAGHRTTSGAPLRHINLLKRGDIIIIRKMGVEQQWEVEGSAIVPPSAVDVIKSRPGTRKLAILACNPPFSAKERLVVNAALKQETVERVTQTIRAESRFKGGW